MKEELSDFMKLAYKLGRVKDVEEAFEEFPIEEEYHKGKTENILCEEKETYNTYSVGDIVFVKTYTYKNGNLGNNHLFVIIDKGNLVVPIENFCMLISSNLDKDSIVKTDVIYKIRNEQILFKIGEVDIEKIEEYKQSYYK